MKLPDVSIVDVHIYGGLTLAAAGGWQFSPALTCLGLGVALALLGLFAPPARPFPPKTDERT